MEQLLQSVVAVSGLIVALCVLLIVVRMFQNHRPLAALVTLASTMMLIGLGIAQVLGWRNRQAWRLQRVMPLYSLAMITMLLSGIGWIALRASAPVNNVLEASPEFDVPVEIPDITLE